MTDTPIKSRANKRNLWIIAGLPVLVMFVATALYHATINGKIDVVGTLGTKNRGDLLIPAIDIAKLELHDTDNKPATWSTTGAWTVVIPATDGCDSKCLDTLMTTRQVHLSLGREESRARRVLLLVDSALDATAADIIAKQHPHLVMLRTTRSAIDQLLETQPQYSVANSTWYLVDPKGWLMMHYSAAHTGKDLLTDLKLLLKYTPEETRDAKSP